MQDESVAEQCGQDKRNIDNLFIESQFATLEGGPLLLAKRADRHYNGGNSKLMNILCMAEGRKKQRKIKEFGDKILLEGGET